MTSRNPKSFISNFKGMCCNNDVMIQEEILHRTRDAYGTEATLGWERQTTHINTQASGFSMLDAGTGTDDAYREFQHLPE